MNRQAELAGSVENDPEQTSDAFVGVGCPLSEWRLEWHYLPPQPRSGRAAAVKQVDRSQETREALEAAHGRSDSQPELAEVLRQRAAISEVLHAIASSPHDLQPIFEAILDSAARVCRAEVGVFRLVEEAGLRLVAHKISPVMLKGYPPPLLLDHSSFVARFIASKSPVHIPDLAAHEVYRAGEAYPVGLVKSGLRTALYVPMLRNDELIGVLSVGRGRIEPFTEKEIELVTDFAAEAAIALEITRRERQLREVQMELAHANRVATMGQITASIAHEVQQPLSGMITCADAGLRFLNRSKPDLEEAKEAFQQIVADGYRAAAVIARIRDLIKKAPPRKGRLNINRTIREVIELTRGEAVKNCVSVQMELADDLPVIEGDRVQLQQVMLNLIVNGIQAINDVADGQRDLLITTEGTKDGVRVRVRDTGPGLSSEKLERLFEPFYTTKPNGMGMGLSICRSIIEAHGGRLWATGHASQGAVFQFTIPARPA